MNLNAADRNTLTSKNSRSRHTGMLLVAMVALLFADSAYSQDIVYPLSVNAHGRTRYRVALTGMYCKNKSDSEAGSTEEIYGTANVYLKGPDGKTNLQPLDGHSTNRTMWRGGNISLAEDGYHPLWASIEYSLSEEELKKSRLVVAGHLWEDDVTGDDDLQLKYTVHWTKDGPNDQIVVDFKNGQGEDATWIQLFYSFEPVSSKGVGLQFSGTKTVDKTTGLAKINYDADPYEVPLPELRGQSPRMHFQCKPVIAESKTGKNFLYLSFQGTEFAADKNGALAVDTTSERRYFLERGSLTLEPKEPNGLTLVSNGPQTYSADGAMTSTSGANLGTGVGLSGKSPAASLTGGLSFGKSISQTFPQFGVVNTGNGQRKVHTYRIMQFGGEAYNGRNILAMAKKTSFARHDLHEVPELAKANLPVISQATYSFPKNTRYVTVKVRLWMRLLRAKLVRQKQVNYDEIEVAAKEFYHDFELRFDATPLAK